MSQSLIDLHTKILCCLSFQCNVGTSLCYQITKTLTYICTCCTIQTYPYCMYKEHDNQFKVEKKFAMRFFPLYCLENGWSSVPCMTIITRNLTIFSLGTSRQVLESDSTLCCTAQGETYRWSCLRLFSTWPHLLRHLYIHMNLAGGTVAWRGCGKYGSIRWTLQKVKHVFSCWLHGCTAYWTKSGLYCAKIVCSSVLCQNCPYMKISF